MMERNLWEFQLFGRVQLSSRNIRNNWQHNVAVTIKLWNMIDLTWNKVNSCLCHSHTCLVGFLEGSFSCSDFQIGMFLPLKDGLRKSPCKGTEDSCHGTFIARLGKQLQPTSQLHSPNLTEKQSDNVVFLCTQK